jgi:hypothetical protein
MDCRVFGMRLPHGEQAVVDLVKLRDYCLNSTHPRGRHKARVFAAVLGLTAADADHVRTALLQAALTEDAISTEQDEFGQRYVIDFWMQGSQGAALVRSAWICAHRRVVSTSDELLCALREEACNERVA